MVSKLFNSHTSRCINSCFGEKRVLSGGFHKALTAILESFFGYQWLQETENIFLTHTHTHTLTHPSVSEVRGLRLHSAVVHTDTVNLCVVSRLMETLWPSLNLKHIIYSCLSHTHFNFISSLCSSISPLSFKDLTLNH